MNGCSSFLNWSQRWAHLAGPRLSRHWRTTMSRRAGPGFALQSLPSSILSYMCVKALSRRVLYWGFCGQLLFRIRIIPSFVGESNTWVYHRRGTRCRLGSFTCAIRRISIHHTDQSNVVKNWGGELNEIFSWRRQIFLGIETNNSINLKLIGAKKLENNFDEKKRNSLKN